MKARRALLAMLTVGLLAFLLVDGASEGLESAELLPESFQGVVLFGSAAAGASVPSARS